MAWRFLLCGRTCCVNGRARLWERAYGLIVYSMLLKVTERLFKIKRAQVNTESMTDLHCKQAPNLISCRLVRARSPPPPKANRVQSSAGLPDIRKWESCRTMPLVDGFSRGSPFFPVGKHPVQSASDETDKKPRVASADAFSASGRWRFDDAEQTTAELYLQADGMKVLAQVKRLYRVGASWWTTKSCGDCTRGQDTVLLTNMRGHGRCCTSPEDSTKKDIAFTREMLLVDADITTTSNSAGPCPSHAWYEIRCRTKLQLMLLGNNHRYSQKEHQHTPPVSGDTLGTRVSLLASHQSEPGSIPRRVTPGFLHVGIAPEDAAVRRVFPRISFTPHPFIPTLLLVTSSSFIVSHDLASLVHTVFDTSWRTLAQSSPSTVTENNHCAVDIGIFALKAVESNLQLRRAAKCSLLTGLPCGKYVTMALIGERRRYNMLLANDAILLASAAGVRDISRCFNSVFLTGAGQVANSVDRRPGGMIDSGLAWRHSPSFPLPKEPTTREDEKKISVIFSRGATRHLEKSLRYSPTPLIPPRPEVQGGTSAEWTNDDGRCETVEDKCLWGVDGREGVVLDGRVNVHEGTQITLEHFRPVEGGLNYVIRPPVSHTLFMLATSSQQGNFAVRQVVVNRFKLTDENDKMGNCWTDD
ncbi:hypothetical protein PR048_012073 [Dryococelus australis]|uniref:Uncharacterized protein n=1 Tax=Dryococelus australis TaxID=614101 RepID=A0ABQ9HNF8_9NEOP|nr:hypothetical protein PR048_012073 [Dryococelus australis]